MVQRLAFVVDPGDPRAPSQLEWDRLSAEERERVVQSLPDLVPVEIAGPEGDPHREAKASALDALGRFFQRIGRRIYLSSELAVYYPGEPRFVPDLLAVLDVEPHERMKWVVAAEGRGLDFVLEVHVSGDAAKDHEKNVTRYAALGIPEYFIFDRGRSRLAGYRLPDASARAYAAVLPQAGRFASHVLGLDLTVVGTRLRFFHGTAPLEVADELIGRLACMVDDLLAKKDDAERLLQAERAAKEAERAAKEAERAAKEAALVRVAELEEQLRRG